MIALLKGRLSAKSPGRIILEAAGVGYGVNIPLSTFLELGEAGDNCTLLIYTHMSDSSISLYGFYSESERDLFLKLIGISGIGPKIAINILSGIGASDLREAIISGDTERISRVPGIGKKTAMRIALELQEKLGESARPLSTLAFRQKEDLASALMNLGFKRKEVVQVIDAALESCEEKAEFEILLRECLNRLAKI